MSKQSEFLTCQRLLSLMVFLGFLIHHVLRANMSTAIVEMVAKNNQSETYGPRFNWNEEEKNNVLGYFFWGFLITQIPGGTLSEKYGPKIVVGIGLLTASVFTLLTPKASQMGLYWLLFTRFCVGVGMGVHWPSTPTISANWIPSTDSSKFMSHQHASSLGVALMLPISGYLIVHFGWPSVFYVTGSIALVWTLCWFYLVYDTPNKHPRINNGEKEKLRKLVEIVDDSKRSATPWKKIITSGPVWAIIVSKTCYCFTFFFAFSELPSYMSQVLHLEIKQIGWLSSVPYLVKYLVALSSAAAADKIIKRKAFPTTAVRKFLVLTLFLINSCVFAVQALWGYNNIVTVVVFTASLGSLGFGSSGIAANMLDISPSYSGTIYGIAQVPCALAGYITTKLVGLATKEKRTFNQWVYMFWTLVAINLLAGIFSWIFISGDRQGWDPQQEESVNEKFETVSSVE